MPQAHYRDHGKFHFARSVLVLHNVAHQGERGWVGGSFSWVAPCACALLGDAARTGLQHAAHGTTRSCLLGRGPLEDHSFAQLSHMHSAQHMLTTWPLNALSCARPRPHGRLAPAGGARALPRGVQVRSVWWYTAVQCVACCCGAWRCLHKGLLRCMVLHACEPPCAMLVCRSR